ncbi:MAG: cytochrome c biogenesis protein CcsA [Bacteroidota bacterium]
MLGLIGSFSLLAAFVAALLAVVGYYQATTQPTEPVWRRLGRWSWSVSTVGVMVASGILFYLLLDHQYQYAYVYQNSSLEMPFKYQFSAFWSGQEGSFLLWILYSGFVGWALMRWAGSYENPVMTVVAFCQVFMVSMVVGLQFGAFQIGSSPFTLLAERFPDAPVFQSDPNFVPSDGTGLNDLLQNPWMVIHPPTLFIGFASMIVPFAFAIAALWQRRYTEWVRPALPWTLFGVMILGVGIAMGGYWAYVTLSFGGYWAWDPVENSSLVPWLIGVAAIHTMIVQKKSGNSQKASLLLSIFAYLFVVYSTFLTRSGVLGDVSVHSFVDLGLYSQLVLWISAMALVGVGLFIYRYRELPTPKKEPNLLSREFMIFSGAMFLTAWAAVIILGTSSPIIGQLFRENPSIVPIEFYNRWTLPLALGFVFLIGVGQLFWWNKMTVESMNRVLLRPLVLATACTIAVLIFTPFVEQTVVLPAQEGGAPLASTQAAGFLAGFGTLWASHGQGLMLAMLLFFAFFALFGNGSVLWRIGRGNLRLAGGAITHIGFAITVLGIISSGAFSNPLARDGQVTQNGVEQRDNFVLVNGQTRLLNGYQVTYSGTELNERGRTLYIIDIVDRRGRAYTLKPEVYQSEADDQWIQHPDLKKWMEKDLYLSVTPSAMYENPEDEENPGRVTLREGGAVTIGNQEYMVRLAALSRTEDPAYQNDSTEVAVVADLEVTNLETQETRTLTPVYRVQTDGTQQFVQYSVADWGMTVVLSGIDVGTGEVEFIFEGVRVMPEDWIVVTAYEKPYISLLWFGIILLSLGFCVSVARRVQDQRLSIRRGLA